jgi:hypothetical protein
MPPQGGCERETWGWFAVPTGRMGDHRESRSQEVPSSERCKEIKRRRHRRKKIAQFARKLPKATVSERAEIARKLRSMTSGGQAIIDAWELEKR